MDYVTIDFEASCLPRHGRSFPIEVAICGDEGVTSWLIRPHPLWRDWHWASEAERLHGITRATLERDGVEAAAVLPALLHAVGARRIVADSLLDAGWFDTLAEAAGIASPRAIDHADRLLDALGVDTAERRAARVDADRLCPARHRAGADARWLWTLLRTLERSVAARCIAVAA